MDSVHLSSGGKVLDGLRDMMAAAIGENDYVYGYVDVPIALLIIEVAKRAEDRADWFPRGKWATIQEVHRRTDIQLDTIFRLLPAGTKPA